MKSTALIGLGNLLMSDEGIGVRVVHELIRLGAVPEDVEAIDLGPGGLQVLHECSGRDKAIFVDCGFMDKPPGTIVRFHAEDARSQKVRARQSLHEGDLFETLELADSLGKRPAEVVIFAIQPETVSLGEHLSDLLESKLESYVQAVSAELNSDA